MELVFWQHINGGRQRDPMSLEQVFAWNIRYQILCRDQEELELLTGYQLMFGRQVQVDVFEEWKKARRTERWSASEGEGTVTRLLPITFTTFRTRDGQLRGL